MTPAIRALQRCLAAEHAAVYGYGVVGGVLAVTTDQSSTVEKLAVSTYDAHRLARDGLVARISGLGATPRASLPAYGVPFPIHTTADCRRFARLLEERCAAVYADAVADTVGSERRLTALGLRACAEHAVQWGAAIVAFPGASDL